ncbi:MAG: valine--tRNA ligase [Thermoanaerobaculia bacterium]
MKKSFDPSSYEERWQRHWYEQGYFRAEAPSRRPSYCIMIPPPNVTGRLHMGHALQSSIQDLLTRWRRMRGDNALWLPGTDHAGIATQLMLERQLAAEGTSRAEIGREAFLERAWAWTEEHHGHIRRQLDKLGASCDWSRERFTMDEGLSRAVRHAFVRLHGEGRIYRGEYMVNWSPGLDTAISDLEVEMREVRGKLYHIAYPVEGTEERVVVATTRPETMLGDTAIAYHPDDERYRHLAGSRAVLPLVGRRLPFVADEAVDPEFGTGLVKVTPSHDFADFELGRRHGLPGVQVIDRHARMTEAAGEGFAGLDRYEARERVVERLREQGLLVRAEDYTHNVGFCQRSGVAIEPLVSTQWFCDVSEMARQALGAVEEGRMRLVPESWHKTWAHWLENIRPWCVSRQLCWGHRIPAWYDADGTCYVAETEEAARRAAGEVELTQDPDVLDTWFSSALWPFSTLGWPDDTPDLETFYPTQVLVTGHDILFFWVARMVMTGLHFTSEVPFHTVHLTGLVRDEKGVKMSKTRGNTVDPMDLVEEFGADAVRFTLSILDSPGRDIPLDRDRVAGYRAFGNKIWNAARFVLGRVPEGSAVQEQIDTQGLEAPERWVLSRLSRTAAEVDARFAEFRFDEACQRLYHFFWHELCDWYLELAKPALAGEAPRPRVGDVLLTALDRSLRLLHPVMPFLSEELWQRLPGHLGVHAQTICLAPYPQGQPAWEDDEVEAAMGSFTDVVSAVRGIRADLQIPPASTPRLHLGAGEPRARAFLAGHASLLAFLARVEVTDGTAPAEGVTEHAGGVELVLTLPGRDLAAEKRQRVARELQQLEAQIGRVRSLLDDERFVERAPAAVVEENRRRLEDLERRRAALGSSIGAEP